MGRSQQRGCILNCLSFRDVRSGVRPRCSGLYSPAGSGGIRPMSEIPLRSMQIRATFDSVAFQLWSAKGEFVIPGESEGMFEPASGRPVRQITSKVGEMAASRRKVAQVSVDPEFVIPGGSEGSFKPVSGRQSLRPHRDGVQVSVDPEFVNPDGGEGAVEPVSGPEARRPRRSGVDVGEVAAFPRTLVQMDVEPGFVTPVGG